MNKENTTPEEINEEMMSAFEMESYDEASSRLQKEEVGGNRAKVVKINKEGDYRMRFIVLHKDSPVKGFSFPFNRYFMPITVKGSKKPKFFPVFKATDNGFEKDLLVEYKKIAMATLLDMAESSRGAKKKELTELAANMKKGSYQNPDSLLFDNKYASYVLDLESAKTRKIGWQVIELSWSQWTELKKANKKYWDKLIKTKPNQTCPVSNPFTARPVDIENEKINGKTSYKLVLDVEEKDRLSKQEVDGYLALNPLFKEYSGYTKFNFESTLVFLQQYDAAHGLDILGSDEFKEVITSVKAQLDPADTSSFSADSANSSDEGDAEDGILIDELFEGYDELRKDKVKADSVEMQAFRDKIRKYITQEGIDFKLDMETSTGDALDALDEIIEKVGEKGVALPEIEDVKKPTETETEEEEEKVEESSDTKEEEEPAPVRRVRRSKR